jgi:hypothetical protein
MDRSCVRRLVAGEQTGLGREDGVEQFVDAAFEDGADAALGRSERRDRPFGGPNPIQ